MRTTLHNSLTRRDLIAGSALAACAAAALPVAAHADEPERTWEAEADIVVVGYGNAGIGAAKATIDAGGTVVILEKAPKELAGGSLSCNDGNWSYVNPESLVNGSFHVMSQELAEEINNDGSYYSDWLADCGLEWIEKTNSVGQTVLAARNGLFIWEAANTGLESDPNVTIVYECPGVELITNASGEVVGVVGERNGERLNFRAKKGVVIATGTYASNPRFITGHHYACLPYASGTSPYNTGDGMVMAARIGAQAFQDLALAIEFGQLAIRPASEELGMAAPLSSLAYRGVMVNGKGKRFMAEDVDMGHNKSTEPILTIRCTNKDGKKGNYGNGFYNLPAWIVMNEEILNSGILMLPFGWIATRGFYTWSDDNQAEIDKGWLLKADTLENLAAQMHSVNSMTGEEVVVDVEQFVQTMADYNAAAEAGEDPLGKNPDYLVALGEGPYYAVEVYPSVMYTNQGITVNDDIQVLDWDGNPIPGLYAAGDVASRLRATRICMTGNIVTGGHAAKHAMGREDHEA